MPCISKAQGGRADRRSSFGPKFLEPPAIGHDLFGFVEQQLAARLVAVEADQCVGVVNQNHRVAQMAQLLGRLLHGAIVAVRRQQSLQQRLALLERCRVAQGNAQAVVVRYSQRGLEHLDAGRRLEVKHAEIFVVDPDPLGG